MKINASDAGQFRGRNRETYTLNMLKQNSLHGNVAFMLRKL